jgi:hypothetical protein
MDEDDPNRELVDALLQSRKRRRGPKTPQWQRRLFLDVIIAWSKNPKASGRLIARVLKSREQDLPTERTVENWLSKLRRLSRL